MHEADSPGDLSAVDPTRVEDAPALHQRLLRALVYAAVVGVPGAVWALLTDSPGLAAAIGLAVLAGCVFGLEARRAGAREQLARLALACLLAALVAPVAGVWAGAFAKGGPLAAYAALGRFGESTLEWLGNLVLAVPVAAAFLAPLILARGGGLGGLAQLRAVSAGLAIVLLSAGGAVFASDLGVGQRRVTWVLVCCGGLGLIMGGVLGLGGLVGFVGDKLARGLRAPALDRSVERATDLPLRRRLGVALSLLVGISVGADAIRFVEHLSWRFENLAHPIGALRTISTSQSLFREGDRDRDGVPAYAGSPWALGEAGLVDEALARGVTRGYAYQVIHGVRRDASDGGPEFLWAATAYPLPPRGGRVFFTNHEGAIFYTTAARPLSVDPRTCAVPPGLVRVGR